MSQEFVVLQCYRCHMFQVDIVKKTPKWTCKICGERQSVQKIYCKGSGIDCRLYVQKVNEIRLKRDAEICEHPQIVKVNEQLDIDSENESLLPEFIPKEESSEENKDTVKIPEGVKSKWDQFISESDSNDVESVEIKDLLTEVTIRKLKAHDVILKKRKMENTTNEYTSEELGSKISKRLKDDNSECKENAALNIFETPYDDTIFEL